MNNSTSSTRKPAAKGAKGAGLTRAGRLLRGAVVFSLTLLAGWHGARLLSGGQFWGAGQLLNAGREFFAPRSECDVLVLGGTPSGIAAALAASRSGASEGLVGARPRLGAAITYAMLNMFDVPLGPAKNSGNALSSDGIFGEFYRQLGVAFDIGRAQKLFDATLQKESNVRVLRGTSVQRLLVGEKRLEGALVRLPGGGEETIRAGAIVDASDDAQFAARAGAGYSVGRENSNPDKRMQAAGLLFSVQGVDWNAVQTYVKGNKALSMRDLREFKHGAAGSIDVKIEGRGALLRLGGASGNYAWERGDIIKDYVPQGPNIVVLSVNFGRQDDGSVVLNTLNIVGVDGLNVKSRQRARAEATREIPLLIKYLQTEMPGFGRARLARIAPELYIRETRHIHGFTSLQVADIKSDRAFDDRIALCSYPLDLHPYSRGETNPFGPQRFTYTLPLRALVPRNLDGVFVASRSLSASYSAAGSARVIPITMAAGQAAGMAATLCAKDEISPHQLVANPQKIKQLQDELRAAGLDIGDGLVKERVQPEVEEFPRQQVSFVRHNAEFRRIYSAQRGGCRLQRLVVLSVNQRTFQSSIMFCNCSAMSHCSGLDFS